jgi:hypothetical protein
MDFARVVRQMKIGRLARVEYWTWYRWSDLRSLRHREDASEVYGDVLGLVVPRDCHRRSTRLIYLWAALGWLNWIAAPIIRAWNPCNGERIPRFQSVGCEAPR